MFDNLLCSIRILVVAVYMLISMVFCYIFLRYTLMNMDGDDVLPCYGLWHAFYGRTSPLILV